MVLYANLLVNNAKFAELKFLKESGQEGFFTAKLIFLSALIEHMVSEVFTFNR